MTSDPADAAVRLSVSAVARRLGVAPATLRTWDRRYGLGPSAHSSGSHRRYGPADLARLETMRRLILQGAAPGEAARYALEVSPDVADVEAVAAPVSEEPGPAGSPGRAAAREVEATVRGLLRAAEALDSETVTRTARAQLARHGVIGAWEQVLLPVLVVVGARWAATGDGVEVEHLLSDCVAGALREHGALHAPVHPPRPVLLACAPGDLHVLPLHALAAGLAEQGTAARLLGAAMPADALGAAVRRTGPAALFLWSQTAATADVTTLAQLPVTRPATVVVAGGPGWDAHQLPEQVVLAADLGAAVGLVGRAVHG